MPNSSSVDGPNIKNHFIMNLFGPCSLEPCYWQAIVPLGLTKLMNDHQDNVLDGLVQCYPYDHLK